MPYEDINISRGRKPGRVRTIKLWFKNSGYVTVTLNGNYTIDNNIFGRGFEPS